MVIVVIIVYSRAADCCKMAFRRLSLTIPRKCKTRNNSVVKKNFFVIFAILLISLITSCSQDVELTVDQLLMSAVEHGDNGNWPEALRFAEQAFEKDKRNVDAAVIYSIALEHNSKFTKALDEIVKVGSSAPNHFMAQFTQGRMLFNRGEDGGGMQYYSDALVPLDNAIAIRPNSIETKILIARTKFKLGIYDEAAKYYSALRKETRFSKKPEAYNEAGISMALDYCKKPAKKKLDYAKAFMNLAYKRGKDNPQIVFNTAVLYDLYLKKPATADKLYQRFMTLTEDKPEFSKKREQVLARRKNISQ